MPADDGTTTPAPDPDRWAPGTPILWRYRENAGEQIHICRPVTVVQDTADLLAVWLAPGTECVHPVIADGTPLNAEPLATRYTRPRALRHAPWYGTGLLKLARPGEPWSVWLFWRPDWEFKNWYVNLEEPLARTAYGVDSEDHFLDISVAQDRSWRWLDEDEFAAAQQAGLMGAEQAAAVRRAGEDAVRSIRSWGAPFCDGWQWFRPDPDWPRPLLPDDWDRTPAHVSS
ncbi:DUF402 domain-containing protein [Streptomyces sp. NPDC058045]|uniref:cytidylyl-2-hydroxypropylphosphonate hydrolase n=1 Tax=Streptomyces sp. NPDC058045 TaxID=3346311 RepID=UPI0036E33F46